MNRRNLLRALIGGVVAAPVAVKAVQAEAVTGAIGKRVSALKRKRLPTHQCYTFGPIAKNHICDCSALSRKYGFYLPKD